MTDFARELTVAVELARKAGVAIMKVYATDFSVAYKGKNDPVTDADKRGNELIVNGLRQAFPDDIIVAEESEKPDDTQTGNRIWYVDPVDGTKEFINKNGEFSVMIGLAVNGQAKVGVVFKPDGDVLYAGVVGQEAPRTLAQLILLLGEAEVHRRSRIVTFACPPPSHMVCRP